MLFKEQKNAYLKNKFFHLLQNFVNFGIYSKMIDSTIHFINGFKIVFLKNMKKLTCSIASDVEHEK